MSMEKSFTDDEIIKALNICVKYGSCKECPINPKHGNYGYCTNLALMHALDLINRQKAEIERLNEVVERLQKHNRELCMLEKMQIDRIKSEARKEFAEGLRSNARKYTEYDEGGWDRDVYAVEVAEIDNLLKEMEANT